MKYITLELDYLLNLERELKKYPNMAVKYVFQRHFPDIEGNQYMYDVLLEGEEVKPNETDLKHSPELNALREALIDALKIGKPMLYAQGLGYEKVIKLIDLNKGLTNHQDIVNYLISREI